MQHCSIRRVLAIAILAGGICAGPQPSMATARTRYVAPHGDCGGAEPCYASPQTAVDDAWPGDEILLAAGTYDTITQQGGQPQVLFIDKDIVMRGGYTIEQWEVNDPLANLTILDAHGAGRVIVVTEADVLLSELSIRGGDTHGLGGGMNRVDGDGGGIQVLTATLKMDHCQITNNYAASGGGLYADHSAVTLSHSDTLSNTAAIDGAGVRLVDCTSHIHESLFQGNQAEQGGAVSILQGHTDLRNNQILENGQRNGAGLLVLSAESAWIQNNNISDNEGSSGAGIALSGSHATLLGNTIERNSGSYGGGIYISLGTYELIENTISDNRSNSIGGGLAINGNPRLVRNIITRNSAASWGGGVCTQMSRPILIDNLIEDNHADEGGGLYMNMGFGELHGNLIRGNTAEQRGGGACLVAYYGPGHTNNVVLNNDAPEAAGLYLQEVQSPWLHTTIAYNSGGDGVGIWAHTDQGLGPTILTLTNSIIVGHTVGVTSTGTLSHVRLDGVLWYDNLADISDSEMITVTHALHGDPVFASDGYHLSAPSAAIDAGLPVALVLDIDGEPRTHGSPDFGADEYWPSETLWRSYLALTR